MKKLFALIWLMCFSLFASATNLSEELPFFVKVTSTNDVSKWFKTPTDNVGFALSVSTGTCKIEYSFESFDKCSANDVTPFDWMQGSVTGPAKDFESMNGVGCARLNCTSGTGVMFIRRH